MGELTRVDSMGLFRTPKGPAPSELFWTCKVCGVIEPLLLPSGRYIQRSCACQRTAREAERAAQERRKHMDVMLTRTYGGWLGEGWKDTGLATKRFDDFHPEYQQDPKDVVLLRGALRAARQFAQHPHGTFLLYGPFGVGKTHLLASICNAVREELGMPSLFTTSPKFFTAFYDHMEHDHNEWSLVRQAIGTPLLIFDDLDKATPKEFRKEVFYQVIDERVKAKRPIGISTNRMTELDKYIGEAAYSRLMEGTHPIEMVGSDYRPQVR